LARNINKAGLDLIKHFEGFRAQAYICPAGVWTIGYGHTSGVSSGQRVTEQKAEQLLHEDLADAQAAVERYIAVPLTDNQFAALVSFTFNLGAGNLKTSTLRRRLNTNDYDAVPSELARWVKANGKTLEGLFRRRAAEGELFMRPDDAAVSTEVPPMPQRVESVEENIPGRVEKGYLNDDTTLEIGCADDWGDEQYLRLFQNVPDGYVYDLQNDLRSLGFTEAGEPDGAFGRDTKRAVKAFQKEAGIKGTGIVDRDTKDVITTWLEKGHTRSNPPGGEEEPVIVPDGIKLITPRVSHFSQGDPRWAKRTLERDTSIRREGCAISCIAMILSFYGRNVTPGTLDSYLGENSGYDGNSVNWHVAGKCGECSSGPKLKYARTTGSKKKLADFLSQRLDKNLPTMARVDYGIDTDLVYNHFVVCVGKTENNDFIMNDPATRRGDGYENTTDENILQRTMRKSGYSIVQLDHYDPV